MRGKLMVVAATAFAMTGAALQASPGADAAPLSVPGTSCTVFPSNNVWNMDVSKLPVNAKSKMWKRSAHAGTTLLHPDFGPPSYGIPYDVVDGTTHSFSSVTFQYKSESDAGPYPFDGATTVEGGSDRHALMVDSSDCVLYELYHAQWNAGAPTAGSGAIFDLTSNALRPAGWTSADAAGLPIFPGLVRWDEVQAGQIDHAIRFTVDCTTASYVWPARHQAGVSDTRCPPMGARFRLRAGFDMTGFSADARVILHAMQHYGMIVADNGSNWYFQGTVDPGWTNGLLDELKSVRAKAFVAVDESGCKVSADSAAFAYGPACPAP
ncbi:MAG: hypothetical protein QOI81_892 [Actinomycetota bacterium]|jgi:hypothetical protein|nr:hypothetical protein [Actinomycetota bacterium]